MRIGRVVASDRFHRLACRIGSGLISRQTALVLLAAAAFLVVAVSPAQAAQTAANGEWKVSPDLHELLEIPEHGRTLQVMLTLFQLAAMLIAAKLLGWAAVRVRVPGVIGELLAGAIIGPYLLGSIIRLPLHGHWVPLFPHPAPGEWPVNQIDWSLAQFASIVLLFMTGLHTDLKQFMRYLAPATLIAVAGVITPFLLGVGVVYVPFFAEVARPAAGHSVLIPALFIGAILTATSIGITARVLGDSEKLDTAEGVTILGAAVLDDVLGIIALAIVGGMAAAAAAGGGASVPLGSVTLIAVKAFGIWIALTGLVLLLANWIERFFGHVKYAGAPVALGMALAFICSGVAELFGLAFIIGAYSVGLGLSRTRMAGKLMEDLRPIGDFIVPIFFASLGMLVDFNAMLSDWRVILFGIVLTLVAIIGKILGCGLAALPAGFNWLGAYRIGLGMMPRGEVALIVAGIGLSRNLIGTNVFGVSIMMTLLTTILAPILLVPAFASNRSGRRVAERRPPYLPSPARRPGLVSPVPPDLAEALLTRFMSLAARSGWEQEYQQPDEPIYLLRNRGDAASVRIEDGAIHIDSSDTRQDELTAFLDQARQSIAADVASAWPASHAQASHPPRP